MNGPNQLEYGSVLDVSRAPEWEGFRFFGEGFFKPRAMSANSRNLLLFGGPPGRLSHARSPVGPLRLYLGAIQRPSGEAFSLPPFFGIHSYPKPEHLKEGFLWRWFYV